MQTTNIWQVSSCNLGLKSALFVSVFIMEILGPDNNRHNVIDYLQGAYADCVSVNTKEK